MAGFLPGKDESGSEIEGLTRHLPSSDALNVAVVDDSGNQIQHFGGGIGVDGYDYVSVAYPTSSTETYTFKSGGASGTLIATIAVVYTDSTKQSLSTVTKS